MHNSQLTIMGAKKLRLILVLTAALLFVGCEIPFISKEKPEEVVADMFAKLSTLESVAFNSAISVVEPGSQNQTNLKISGQSSFADGAQPAVSLNIDLAVKTDQEFTLAGSAIFSEVELYLKLDQISNQEAVKVLAVELNKWYALSGELQQLGDLFGLSALSEQNTEQPAKLTNQQKQELRGLVRRANFIKVNQVLDEEEIGGQKCYHYRLFLDQDLAKQFFDDFSKIIGTANTNHFGLNGTDLIDDYFANQADRTYEIWITKASHWPAKLATKTVTLNETIQTKTESSLILELSQYNQQFNITKPAPVEDFDLTKLYSSMLLGAENLDLQEMDLEKDTDGDGLADYVESVYQTDPKNPDSDGDGFLDGEELEHGYNPLGEGELNL